MEDLYEILQCEQTATREELRRAYTRLALVHHPDKQAQRQTEDTSQCPAPAKASLPEYTHELDAQRSRNPDESSPSFSSGAELGKDDRFTGVGMAQNNSANRDTTSDLEFVKIDNAWKILGDPDLRVAYDIKWRDRCLAQDHPIQDTVPFEEFDFDDEEEVFTYPCRCGSEFVLSQIDRQLMYDYVCCETCSLTIRLCYEGT